MDPQSVHTKFFKVIYRFFYYRDVDKEEIEDLCQETFFRFFNKYTLENLTEIQITKILYTIARNVWREWLRKMTATKTEELFKDDGAYDLILESSEDGDNPDLEGERAQLIEAINNLNPTLRTVLTMRFVEGKTRREIAEHLGTKEKYVHIYQQRGIKALQKILKTVSPSAHT